MFPLREDSIQMKDGKSSNVWQIHSSKKSQIYLRIKYTFVFEKLLTGTTEPTAIILDGRFCSPASGTSLYCSVNQKLNDSLDLKPTLTETGTRRMTHYP